MSDSANIHTDTETSVENKNLSYIKLYDDGTTTIKYIYHMSDIHIRNTSRHDEYREVFERTYTYLRENIKNNNSIIVLTGDIMHTKTELSPEAVSLAANLFKKLSEIATVILIPGNHDMNLSNKNRMDALTPIVEDIGQLKNFYYLKKSGIYQFNNLIFGFTSVIDDLFISAKEIKKDHIKKIKQKKIFKIALYHGPVHGSELDVGFRMNREQLTVDNFEGYDYGLLGDIHKYQFLDKNKTIAYSGSLIQQSHGESIKNHGILKWDLINGDHEHIPIKNNYGYCTINIKNGVIEDTYIPKNARARFVLEKTNKLKFEEILKELKKKYNITEVVLDTNHRKTLHLGTDDNTDNSNSLKKKSAPMTAFSTQRNIISDYLRTIGLDDPTRKDILELHQKIYQKILEEKKDAVGDIHHLTTGTQKWKILELRFSNTLSYGEDNFIDFRNYDKNKIIGIIAPNFHGKTAILDVILFCLFDKFSRGERRDILNKDRNKMYCSLLFSVGNDLYHIERIGQRSKNGLTVKIDVNFHKIELDADGIETKKNLNGLDKNETNKKICEIIGEYNDYILTAFSLNLVGRTSNFGDMTQLQKKEYLNEILKLNIFEDCHNYAKEKVKQYTAEIKAIEQNIGSKSIDELRTTVSNLHNKLKDIATVINFKQEQIDFLDGISYQHKLDTMPKYADLSDYDVSSLELIDKSIDAIKKEIKEICVIDLTEITTEVEKLKILLSESEEKCEQLENDPKYIANIKNRQQLLDSIQKISTKKYDIDTLNKTLTTSNDKLLEITNKLKNIDEKNIKRATEQIILIKQHISNLRKEILPMKSFDEEIDIDYLINSNHQLLLNIHNYLMTLLTSMSDTHVNSEKKEELKIILRTKISVIEDLTKLTSTSELDDLILKYKNKCKKINEIIQSDNNILEKYRSEWIKTENMIAEYYEFRTVQKINELTELKISSAENKLTQLNEIINNKIILESLQREQELLKENIKKIKEDIEAYEETIVAAKSNAKLDSEISELNKLIETHTSNLASIKASIKKIQQEINQKEQTIKKYRIKIECIENKKKHLQLLYNYRHQYELWTFKCDRYNYWNNLYENIKKELGEHEKERIKYESQMEMYKKELRDYVEHRTKYDNLSTTLTLYNTYVQTMNYNGLPYEILKKYLPMIEEDINNILHSMVDFSIEFVFYDENKLKELKEKNVKTNIGSVDLNIVRHGKKPYNIQIVSGFEKFIIGLAIRMALMQISLTAKPNFFVIDEGWGSIDSEHINNIGSIMNFIKSQYDHVIIISHLEPLKNEVDYEINIDRNNGFSHLRKSNLKLIKKRKIKVID